jgi:hypothetical protein
VQKNEPRSHEGHEAVPDVPRRAARRQTQNAN